MEAALVALLKELYEAERKQQERNYAKGHSFEEWLDHRRTLVTRLA
jgi:hypothetical protein